MERFRLASEKLEGELSDARLEHDRMAASLSLAQLTATELEKVVSETDVYKVVCSIYKLCFVPL